MKKYFVLTRVRVSAFAALASLTGHVTASGDLRPGAVWAAMGVWLLASGASALNQISERHTDSLMRRTMTRPLPSGTMGAGHAAAVSALLIISGLIMLSIKSLFPALLGLCALIVYNFIYTPLKRLSGFAILFGAVAGALPPAIGWAMSGSSMGSPLLIAICFLFYLWQVPHFWMLLARHREDYERAGLPTLGENLSEAQAKRVGLTWTAATSSAGLMLPLLGTTDTATLALMLAATAILFLSGILGSFSNGRRFYFMSSNIYILFVMISLVSGTASH